MSHLYLYRLSSGAEPVIFTRSPFPVGFVKVLTSYSIGIVERFDAYDISFCLSGLPRHSDPVLPISPPPTPPLPSMPILVQGSSSHGSPFVDPVPRPASRRVRSAHIHRVRCARHQHHHRDADVGVDEDLFGAAPAHIRGLGESKSAPAAGSFGRGGADGGVFGEGAGQMPRSAHRGEQGDGGGGRGADTWVDTDTDTGTEDDGDAGLWQVEAD